jgi:hypothetical protein
MACLGKDQQAALLGGTLGTLEKQLGVEVDFDGRIAEMGLRRSFGRAGDGASHKSGMCDLPATSVLDWLFDKE